MSLSYDDVERLLKALEASSFDEMELQIGAFKLDLRRRGSGAAAHPAEVRAAPAPAAATPAAPGSGRDAIAESPGTHLVRAPMLGTFFPAPQPGAAPFVEVGAHIGPDTTIGIIEVMKLMNAITADVAGNVLEVLACEGDLVEFGQPLLRLRTA